MRLLVCGGRDLDPIKVRDWILDWGYRDKIEFVIEGGATGADTGGRLFAEYMNLPSKTYSACWEEYGKYAGPKRNKQMLDEGKPNFILAFPGGNGTKDMVKRATDRRFEVWKISDEYHDYFT